MKLKSVQTMNNYEIIANDDGVLFYRLFDNPSILFNTGESVSPDELTDYLATHYNIEKILDLCDLSLYSDLDLR